MTQESYPANPTAILGVLGFVYENGVATNVGHAKFKMDDDVLNLTRWVLNQPAEYQLQEIDIIKASGLVLGGLPHDYQVALTKGTGLPQGEVTLHRSVLNNESFLRNRSEKTAA